MLDDSTRSALREVLRSLSAHVEWQRDCGAPWLPRGVRLARNAAPASPAAAATPPRVENDPAVERRPAAAAAVSTQDLFADPGVQNSETLDALRAHIGDCQRCKLAGLGRSTIVF